MAGFAVSSLHTGGAVTDLTRANLPHLHGRDEQFFASWLRGGLDGWFNEEMGSEAFVGAADYVGAAVSSDRDHSISLDLARVQRRLNAVERASFRAGLAKALAGLAPLLPDPKAVGPAVTLLELAPLVSASEALDAIVALTPAMLRIKDEADPDLLMQRTIDAVVALSAPQESALRCLEAIIDFQAFRPSLAYPALLAFCRAAPTQLERHIDRLWPQLSASVGWPPFNDEQRRSDDEAERLIKRQRLIRELFKQVPRSVFLDALLAPRGHIELVAGAPDWAVDDNWLIQAALLPGRGMSEVAAAVTAAIKARAEHAQRPLKAARRKPRRRFPATNAQPNTQSAPLDATLGRVDLARHIKRSPIEATEELEAA
jgi:hypothetical protein